MCKSDARTLTGKRPTAAALQRQHEYMDWLGQLPQPEGDVPPPDNSWSAFMAQRRRAHERARLAQLEEQRKEARHARGLLRRPPRQGPRYGGPKGAGGDGANTQQMELSIELMVSYDTSNYSTRSYCMTACTGGGYT